MSINIINANNATTVHVCGCGCGSGGTGSGGNGDEGLPPGGTEGGATYDGQARVIDICANVDIFINAMNDYIDQAQVLGYVPGLATVNAGLEAITSVSLEELDKLEVELSDPKVTEALRRWVVTRFDDPFGGFTRELLRTLTFRLPLLVGGTLFMPIWRVWAETANIEQLNAQILATAGSASYDGECAELQRSVGREPYRPPSDISSSGAVVEQVDAANGLKYTRLIQENIPIEESRTFSGTADEFVGVLVRFVTTYNGGVSGTAYSQNLFLVLPDETEVNVTDGFPQDFRRDGVLIANAAGRADVGDAAADFDMALFADWDGVTNNLPAGIASTPVAGTTEFTLTASFGSQQGYGADGFTVWVVTADTGSAELFA